MEKYKLDSAYVVKKFEEHENIKVDLLNLIDVATYESPKFDSSEVNITKTDWSFSTTNRDWVSYLSEPLVKNVLEMYAFLGYDGINISQIWFQQYLKDSEHGWHVHGNNFTNVYYLELPEGTPKTQLVNPYNQKEIIEIEVKEGDLLCFPSYVLHKAPKNNSNKRKTIISYNIDVNYSDDNYGKNFL
jgi:uncharacterized RmlC-like cupin family protein